MASPGLANTGNQISLILGIGIPIAAVAFVLIVSGCCYYRSSRRQESFRERPVPKSNHPNNLPPSQVVGTLFEMQEYHEMQTLQTCVICFDLVNPGPFYILDCQHAFHRNCLESYHSRSQKNCPLCRAVFVRDPEQSAVEV